MDNAIVLATYEEMPSRNDDGDMIDVCLNQEYTVPSSDSASRGLPWVIRRYIAIVTT